MFSSQVDANLLPDTHIQTIAMIIQLMHLFRGALCGPSPSFFTRMDIAPCDPLDHQGNHGYRGKISKFENSSPTREVRVSPDTV